jgi:hypothetical protein
MRSSRRHLDHRLLRVRHYANRLDREGAAVEMGDAALGLAYAELTDPPRWAAVRNMSVPVINGDLPAKQSTSTNRPPGAVGYYTAYGR